MARIHPLPAVLLRRVLLTALVAAAVLVLPRAATAQELPPTATPPVFFVEDVASASIHISETQRGVVGQWETGETLLLQAGGGVMIDDANLRSWMQTHLAFGVRGSTTIDAGGQPLRLYASGRLVGEALIKEFGADDDYSGRLALDVGVGVWLATQRNIHAGAYVGLDQRLAGNDVVSNAFETMVVLGMPLSEPDRSTAALEAELTKKMLTTDPREWPAGGFRARPAQGPGTIFTVGAGLSQPMSTSSMSVPTRLILVLGVLYP